MLWWSARWTLDYTVTARRHKYTQSENTCDIVQNTLANASELLQNVEQWAAINNLTLSRAKTSESTMITTKGKSKSLQPLPPLLPDIVRVTMLKIL